MTKDQKRSYALNFSAFICFLLALLLIVLLRLFQLDRVVLWYDKYTSTLSSFEQRLQLNGATWATVGVIMLNYLIKSLIPWFPVSCICVASAAIFKWYFAALINIAGLTLLFSIRFFWGRRFGGGNAERILEKFDRAHAFIDTKKFGSSVVLFFMRFFPLFPINSVSRLYGTTSMRYGEYAAVSLLGFSYKLFSYIVIGRNVFDPLSAKFIVPVVLLLLFSGLAILALNGVFNITKVKRKNKQNKKQKG